MEIVIAVIVLALVVYLLERNHARQAKPRPRMFGSTNIDDREPWQRPPALSP